MELLSVLTDDPSGGVPREVRSQLARRATPSQTDPRSPRPPLRPPPHRDLTPRTRRSRPPPRHDRPPRPRPHHPTRQASQRNRLKLQNRSSKPFYALPKLPPAQSRTRSRTTQILTRSPRTQAQQANRRQLSSKPVRCGNPTLARFDSGAAPLHRIPLTMRDSVAFRVTNVAPL